jgi:hypothetical protein
MVGPVNSTSISLELTSFGRSTSHQDEAGLKALSKRSEITRMIPTIHPIFIIESGGYGGVNVIFVSIGPEIIVKT